MSDQHESPLPGPNGRDGLAGLDLEERGLRPPPEYGPLRRLWWWFDFLILVKLARLRFIAILLAVGAVIVYWDSLNARYEKWVRPLLGSQAAASPDTEFWCPMHPSIVREKPDKCPICAMPLSKRKKGEGGHDEPLPPGVVSRVQLSPYRVALAGITTAEVGYRPLARDITAVGFVEFDERKLARISARATGKSRIDKLHVNVTGQTVAKGQALADLYSPELVVAQDELIRAVGAAAGGKGGLGVDYNRTMLESARTKLRLLGILPEQIAAIEKSRKRSDHLTIHSPIGGHVIRKYQVEGEYVEEGARLYDVADLSTVWVEAQVYEDELAILREGLPARATTRAFPNRAFEGKLAFVHPHLDAATRTLKVRFDVKNTGHLLRPGMYATVKLQVPATELGSFAAARDEGWRDHTAADLAAHAVLSPLVPGGGAGLPSLLLAAGDRALSRRGLVLAVPERAVIDTGSRQLVYREAEPDVYEGVEVELGPRSGGFFPVLRGLQAGDRVATEGSFLIDAETRLTAGASSTYFGAAGGPQGDRPSAATGAARPSMVEDDAAKAQAVVAKLSPADRKLAEEQGYCPVLTDNRLGSMGRPVKLYLKDQPVFLCCKGCLDKARADPEKALRKVAEQRERVKTGTAPPWAMPGPGATKEDPEEADIRADLAKLNPADRKLAEAQRWCPVQTDSRLGSMGKPVKVLVKGQPVFLCCESCRKQALAGADRTLRTVEKHKAKAKGAAPRKGAKP